MLRLVVGGVGRLVPTRVAAAARARSTAAVAAKDDALETDTLLGGIAVRQSPFADAEGKRTGSSQEERDWRLTAERSKVVRLESVSKWPKCLGEPTRRRVEQFWARDAAGILREGDADALALFVAVVSRRPQPPISEEQWQQVAQFLCGAALTRRQALVNLRAFILAVPKMRRGRTLTAADKQLLDHLYRSVQSKPSEGTFWAETYWRTLDDCYADTALHLRLFPGCGDLALTLARLPIDMHWLPSEGELANDVLPLLARTPVVGAKSAALYLYVLGDLAQKLNVQFSTIDKQERLRPLVESMSSAEWLRGVNSQVLCGAVMRCSQWGLDDDDLWAAVERVIQKDKKQTLQPHSYLLQHALKQSYRASRLPIATKTWRALVDHSPATVDSLEHAATLLRAGATDIVHVVDKIAPEAAGEWSARVAAGEVEATEVCRVLSTLTWLQADIPERVFTHILGSESRFFNCGGVHFCNLVEAFVNNDVRPSATWWQHFIKHFTADKEVSSPLLYSFASNTFVLVNNAHMYFDKGQSASDRGVEPPYLLPHHLYKRLLDNISTATDAERVLRLLAAQKMAVKRDVLAGLWDRFDPTADASARPNLFGMLYSCVKLGYCPDGLRSSHLDQVMSTVATAGLGDMLNMFAMLELVFGVKVEPPQWAAALSRVDAETGDMNETLFQTLLKCRLLAKDDALLPEALRRRVDERQAVVRGVKKKPLPKEALDVIRRGLGDEARLQSPAVVEQLNFAADVRLQLDDGGGEELWLSARNSMRYFDLESRSRTRLDSQALLWDALLQSLGYHLRYFDRVALKRYGILRFVHI